MRALLVATGEMSMTDMKITEMEGGKITLGSKWGREPMLCEGIPLTLSLRNEPSAYRCWALDMFGNRKEDVPIKRWEQGSQIEVGPEYKTIWYEIQLQ